MVTAKSLFLFKFKSFMKHFYEFEKNNKNLMMKKIFHTIVSAFWTRELLTFTEKSRET